MKTSKKRLKQIIREELNIHIAGLLSEGPMLSDAQDDQKEKEDVGEKEPQETQSSADNGASPKSPRSKTPAPDSGEPPEQPEGEDPADDKLEQDAEEDPEEKEAEAKKSLSDILDGKSIQSISQEPKSKILPGAQEIVITFNDIPDPLKILVTKSGTVKFFFRNQLHNEV